MTHKKHYSEEGQQGRFIDSSMSTTIRNIINNPMDNEESRRKASKSISLVHQTTDIYNGRLCSKETREKMRLGLWKEHSNHRTYYHKISRQVMEKHLGRRLQGDETVHHLDHDPSNNHMNNLHLFNSNSEHTKYHRMKTKWIREFIEGEIAI